MKRLVIMLVLFLGALSTLHGQSKEKYHFMFEWVKEPNWSDADAQKGTFSIHISDRTFPILMMFNRDNGEKESKKLMKFVICDDEDILHFPTEDNSATYSFGIKEYSGRMQLRMTIMEDDGSGKQQPSVQLFNKEGSEYEQQNNEEFLQLLQNAKSKKLNNFQVDLF